MIDFNYTAPELLPLRIQEVLGAPNEPHRIGGVVYVPDGGGECECDGTIEWQWTGPTTYYEHELSCGHVITSVDNEPPSYCEECGARVRKAVKR